LFTKDGSLILQRRSATKVTFPLLWTNSCCSHPLWNEYEMCEENDSVGIRRAAQRKLEHELGIKALPLDRMKVMGRYIYKADSDGNWGEYELDYAIIILDFDPVAITPNPEEIEQISIVNQSKLRKMVQGT
uniref:isopentenyl-diphosphate Delta-isomerase n=1 Tax=Dracunculus medinensis TaxID=318479 RepID=A0A0N4U1Y5_DRAME